MSLPACVTLYGGYGIRLWVWSVDSSAGSAADNPGRRAGSVAADHPVIKGVPLSSPIPGWVLSM
jgi:hypothetical protein